jgi:tetratricopeptide (TPR) repeat protein
MPARFEAGLMGISRHRQRRVAVFAILFCAGAAWIPGHASVKQDEAFQAGREAYEASQYPKAAQLLQEAAASDPKNPAIQLLLTKTFSEMQRHDDAINSAEKAVSLDPQNSVYHEWLGRAYGEKAEHAVMLSAMSLARKTRKEFAEAVLLDGNNFSARQSLIEYDCAAPAIVGGGEDKARPEIAKLAELDAAEGHYAAGNCRRQKKDFAAADAEFTKALESNPKSATLVYDIGDYAVKHDQPDRLLKVAELGEQLAPSDPRAQFYRGVAYIVKNEHLDDAERLLREYIDRAPTRSSFPRLWDAHNWLGHLLENEGKIPEAVKEYQAALKLDAKNHVARESLKRLHKAT